MGENFEEYQYIKNGIKIYVERNYCQTDTYGNGYWERRETPLVKPFPDWVREQ